MNNATALINPLDDYLGYQLRRAALVTISLLNDAYAEIELTSTEAMVLRFASVNPGCTQSDMGRSLGVKRTNMVPIVSGLIARGLLERTAADGRSHALQLSPKGVERHRRLTEISLQHEQYFFGDLTKRQRQELMQALQTLRRKGEAIIDKTADMQRPSARPARRKRA
ncbi:MAG TPA: MarR family transcriptional regulator [Steroidobacteraceae bacterium]|jgi:DNA-binding MarR family transcriptional regulator|nr:MarR family transcriptional regulator [Steroidobacteraceae bacterium]